AECSRKVGNAEDAEYWYGQVVRLAESEPIHKLFYGQMLQRNGKCDLAKEWYEKYVEEVPDDLRGQYLVKACDYEDELMTKNAGVYELKHLEFNSNLDDMSPTIYGKGLIFASERDKGIAIKRTHTWTGNPFLELYYLDAKPVDKTECGEYVFGAPKKFSNDLNSKFHEAAVTFNNDQTQLYFTRNNYVKGKPGKSDDGIVKLKVFSATKTGDNKWGDMEGLPFNSDEYSVAHPTLTPDGNRLYFASDMPGGFGGMDLYLSEKENGRWGPPLNLGPSINTEGQEIFPYYDARERLYFSSDGQIGLGGLDIYYMEDKGDSEWGPIENLGYPINTISDDFGIVFNEEGTCGFLTSDRDGGAGRDDIYSFKKIASPVQVIVYDRETKEPIESATVVNDCTGNTLTTDAEGKIVVDMKMNECCTFSATMEGYLPNEEQGCTKDIPVGEPVFVEIPMDKEMEFDLEGVVFDQSTGLPLEGATITLTNDCDKDEQIYTTDGTGAYYFVLDKDCCYVVKGEKDGFIAASVGDQCTRGETKSLTLQVNLNLQPTNAGEDYTSND
ncbi:MAG: flagellar motor protein MotB, partial [Bacteroidota bacterium]